MRTTNDICAEGTITNRDHGSEDPDTAITDKFSSSMSVRVRREDESLQHAFRTAMA